MLSQSSSRLDECEGDEGEGKTTSEYGERGLNQGIGGRKEKKSLGHILLIPADCLAMRSVSRKEEPRTNNGISGHTFN